MKKYPEYRESNEKAFGKIPQHWKVMPLKFAADTTLGKMLTRKEREGYHLRPYLRSKNVQWERVDVHDVNEMWFSAKELEQYRLQEGDIVVSEGGEVGRSALWRGEIDECYIQNSVHKISVHPENDPRYFLYHFVLHGKGGYFDAAVNRVSIAHLTQEKLREVPFLLPPPEEQRILADYLDRKTAEIDALVAKKQRLIALLKEQRAAVINRAVTKGLDPSAPMKDSGIAWLGEVPEHYSVEKLRRNWKVVDCKHLTPTYVEAGYPVVSTTEVKPGRLQLNGSRFTTEDEYLVFVEGGRLPKRGDIIYSRNASVGSAAYVDTDELFCMGQDVCLITSEDQDQLFLNYQLNSPVVTQQLESMLVGATFKRINVGQINQFIVVRPPFEEQKRISDYLDRKTAEIDAIIQREQRLIDLLQELRTSLISEAVTGKIDVREAVAA